MAVILLYFHKLNPFSPKKTHAEKRGTWRLWGMVAIGCIPAAIVGLLLDDWVNEHFYNAYTVAIMLILYGVVFIVMERRNRKKALRLMEVGATPAAVSYTHLDVYKRQSDFTMLTWGYSHSIVAGGLDVMS